MDDKKRKAEEQLVPESEAKKSLEVTVPATTVENTCIDNAPVDQTAAPAISAGFGGFSAYAKINPFAAAVSSSGFKNVFGKTDSSTSFGANKVFGKLNTEMPPPLVVPSPRESPKVANPFSSPSPVHNPFMSIVESKDELWQTMAKDRLSADEARKSCFFNDRDFKSAPLSSSGRLNSFGGSAVGGGAFGSRSSAANNDDDGEEDEEGGDNEAELQRAESPTFTKYAMPENVPVVTGEEHEECLLQVRAKLFRLDAGGSSSSKDKSTNAGGEAGPSPAAAGSAEWVEVGIGPVRLLKSRDGVAAGRLVMRREEKKGGIGTKLLLNVRLDQLASVSRQADKVLRVIAVNFAVPATAPATATLLDGSSSSSGGAALLADTSPSIGASSDRASTPAATPAVSTMPALQSFLLKTKNAAECDDLADIASDLISSSRKKQELLKQQTEAASDKQTEESVSAVNKGAAETATTESDQPAVPVVSAAPAE